MPGFEILSILVLAAGVWLWLDSLKVREIAVRAARSACERAGSQFLDETVSIAAIKWMRDDEGQLTLRRTYKFEFSDTGNNRRPGRIVLLGKGILDINLGLRLVAASGESTGSDRPTYH